MKKGAFIGVVLAGLFLVPGGAAAWYYDAYDPYYAYYDPYSYYYPTTYYPTAYYPQTSYYYPQQYYSYEYPTYYQSYYQSYYGQQYYGYSSTPSPYNYSYPVGDTDTFGSPICYWEGYGRGLCEFNPRQPVYDHWTGTWY